MLFSLAIWPTCSLFSNAVLGHHHCEHSVVTLMQEKRIRAKHSINQLQKQVKQQQLQVSTRVKKQVASVRNLPRVRPPRSNQELLLTPSGDLSQLCTHTGADAECLL